MKRRLLLLLACAYLITPIASAHPGRTDGNGGHHDHSTGEYHYHHGYPAHQHTGGVCPYDFDDKTGQNSGGGSGGSPGSKSSTQKPKRSPLVIHPSLLISLSVLACGYVVAKVREVKKESRRREEERQAAEQRQARLREEQQREKERKEAERIQRIRQYEEMYDGKLFEEVFQPPSGFSVNDDGEPLLLGNPLLVSRWHNRPVYHRASCRYAPPVQEAMWRAIRAGARPCKACAPEWYDFSWYWKYINLKKELAKDGLAVALEDGIIYLEDRN